MSTTLATPSPNNAKIRFGETYVSEGLNRKMFAAVPAGIIRGGKLLTTGAGLNVKIDPDPNTGDSVYTFADINGHQLTFRDVGTRTLDLSVGGIPTTTVFIALFISYAVSSPTVVEWRTYTQAELDAAPEGGVVVIVGKVVVPAGGPIDPSDVTPDGRREAWKDQSTGTRPWKQIVKNGSFNEGLGSVSPTVQSIAGYTGVESGGSLTVDATSPRSGLYSLRYVSTSTADFGRLGPGQFAVANPFSGGLIPVRSGQLIDAQFYLSGSLVEDYAAGTSGARLILEVYDAAGALIGSAVQAESDPAVHVGTFGYDRIEKIFAAPGDGYLRWYLDLSIDAGAGTGDFFVDDVRIFLSPGDTAGEDDGSQPVLTEPVVRATALEIAPRNAASDTEASDRVAKIVADIIGGRSVLSLIDGGGLVPQILTALEHVAINQGKDTVGLLGTDKDAGDDTVPTDYKLLHRYALNATISGRVYSKDTAPGALVFTVNAGWTGSGTDLWFPDDATAPAYKMSLNVGSGALASPSGLHLEQKDTPTGASWADSAWSAQTLAMESLDATVPMFKTTKKAADHTGGGSTLWKILFEFKTNYDFDNGAGGGDRLFRLYVGGSNPPSASGSVCLTMNARFDNASSVWVADVSDATEGALRLAFNIGQPATESGRLIFQHKEDTSAGWDDATGWDTGPGTVAAGIKSSGEFGFLANRVRSKRVSLVDGVPALGTPAWDLVLGGAGPSLAWTSNGSAGAVVFPINIPFGYTITAIRVEAQRAAGSSAVLSAQLLRNTGIDFTSPGGPPTAGSLVGPTDLPAGTGNLDVIDLVGSFTPTATEEYFLSILTTAVSAHLIFAIVVEYTQANILT